jgi:LysR family glycine cleavage system transcriptional activator
MVDLPSLNALRAFDVSARHLSFTRAAAELHVTHGAVSRQVKELETFIGRPLFRRLPRGLEITRQGRELAFTTNRLFDELRGAIADLRRPSRPGIITVNTVPSLAARWLVPRISAFQNLHPEYEVRIGTTTALTDFRRDGVDLALRYGRGRWPAVYRERLFQPVEFPVCAPALLEGDRALRAPRDLAHFTLLHDTTTAHWGQWLAAAGATDVDAKAGLVLEDMNVLLQAAIEGQGVALSSLPLAHADLRAGRLVKPFEIEIPVELSFYIVCEHGRESEPALAVFIAWLREQAAPVTAGSESFP